MCNTVMHFVVFFSVAHIDGGMAIEQDWWKIKLAEDIYATLRFKEQTLPAFKVQSLHQAMFVVIANFQVF